MTTTVPGMIGAPPTRSDIGRIVPRSSKKTQGRWLVVVLASLLGILGGIASATLAGSSHPSVVLGLPAILLPLALWKWNEAGVIVVLAIATVVEQVTYTVGPGVSGAFTQNIPLFHSITQGSGVNWADVLLLMVLLIWFMKSARRGTLNLPHSGLSRTIVVLLGLVLLSLVVGLSHGGQFRWTVWEIRPWFYLAAMYWVSASVLRTKAALRAVLWTLVLGSGFKAIQGVKIWIPARHLSPRPEAILAHEEAFFFGLFLFLTLGMWVFEMRGALRTTATCLLPVVLLANLANSRRNSWAILAMGAIVMLVIAYRCLPHRRRMLRRLTVVLLIGSALYFPVFWNNASTIGQPARALQSVIKPSSRDLSSDLYRQQENANLLLNIRQSDNLGKGFGVPIDYALPIENITTIDPLIAYIPHNGVLYLWMRLGIQGEAVFLMMIAAAIFRAVQLTRMGDQELAFVGTLVVCAIVAYLVQGYNDMGFSWFRIALCMGVLFGATEAAMRVAGQPEALVGVTR